MLVLSRKNGQKIIIDDNIEITILESRYDNCKIAISAPKEVKIFREEVYRQIQISNKLSNKSSIDAVDSLASFINEVSDVNTNTNKVIIKKKEK